MFVSNTNNLKFFLTIFPLEKVRMASESSESEVGTRPTISIAEAKRIFSDHYDLPLIAEIKELDSYADRNFYIKVNTDTEYVLKIMCELDSNLHYMTAIAKLLILLDTKNFSFHCSKPILSKNGNTVEMISLSKEVRHLVILLTYIPGCQLKDIYKGNNIDLMLMFEIGKKIGQFETVLIDYYDPGFEFRKGYIWDPAMLKKVGKYIPKIKAFVQPKELELLEKYLENFLQKIEPNLPKFHQNIIHSDLSEANLIVNSTGKLLGIIDFTDCVYSYRLFELGNSLAYLMMHCFSEGNDPFQVARHILQGFMSEIELSGIERDHLLTAVTSRLVMTTVMGYYYYSLEPTNEYLLNTPKPAINLLRHISEHEQSVIEEILFKPL